MLIGTKTRRALTFLFLLSVFILALNKIHELDAWLHLSHGRLLWELKALPEHEMFTYPNSEGPHLYSSWLFGLVSYVLYLSFGAYGLGLLQTVFITGAFFILLRDSLKPYGNLPVAVVVLTLVLTFSRGRFVLRPDITLMVFLSFSIFCLNSYLYEGRKYIYSLPLIHLLWANTHSSISLMFVPFLSFIIGGILQMQLAKRGLDALNSPSASQIKTVAALFALSFAASLLNPNFIGQYYYGYNAFASEWAKTEISELRPLPADMRGHLYAAISAIAASFILSWKRFSAIHLLLVIPFLALPFKAVRFLMLIAMVCGPVFIRNISAFLEAKGWSLFFRKRAVAAIVAVWMLFYAVIAMARPVFGTEYFEFGFGFDYQLIPRGAVQYMDRRDIHGRVLNSFGLGQYIIWSGYPKRTPFTDSRLHLPDDLLEKLKLFRYKNYALDELYKSFGFESIVIYYTVPPNDPILPLLSHPQWALVYWDDLSLLYLRRDGKYDSVIEEDEYRSVRPQSTLESFTENLGGIENQMIIIEELRRNIRETGSSRARTLLGQLYSSTGRSGEAIDVLRSPSSVDDHLVLGDSYRQLGRIDKALQHYKASLKVREDAKAIYRIGASYFAGEQTEQALKSLERAVSMKPDILEAYPLLVDIYLKLGMNEAAETAERQYRRQTALKSALTHIYNGERAYNEKRYDAALEAFSMAIQIDPMDPCLHNDLGYVYLETGRMQEAYKHFSRALELNPTPADATEGIRPPNAYYGMGLFYGSTGDKETAIKYFEKYIGTKSSGYYSGYYIRNAKRQMKELSVVTHIRQ